MPLDIWTHISLDIDKTYVISMVFFGFLTVKQNNQKSYG